MELVVGISSVSIGQVIQKQCNATIVVSLILGINIILILTIPFLVL